MANELTPMIPFLVQGVDIISRELLGMIPAVYHNAAAEQVALDQEIRYPVVGAPELYDIVPSNIPPTLLDSGIEHGVMSISKVKAARFYWTGDDERAIGSGNKAIIQQDKITQTMRSLTNLIEADLAALYVHASRAYGTPGTTPFGQTGDFSDASFTKKILEDNGAPSTDLQLVINTAAGATLLGKQSQVHMVGSDDPLRRGVLLDIDGMQIRKSAAICNHTKGSGSGYVLTQSGGYAEGATTMTVSGGTAGDTGIISGDVIAVNGDPDRYVVGSGINAASGDIAINAPGLRKKAANNSALTIGNSYAANMAFSRSAIHLLTRLPLMPEGGDMARDITVVQDPLSGLAFMVAMYPGYHAMQVEISIAWGVAAVKPEHIALLLG